MQKKKVLVISVSAGSGHVSAAIAITREANRSYHHIDCTHIDMMNYVSPTAKHAIVDVYDSLVRTIPRLWGYVYEKTNDEKRIRYLTKLIKKVTRWNSKAFYKYIEHMQPDEIICTHSFPAQVIRQSKNKEIASLPISLVLTDYGFHSYWIMPKINHYFVATEKMKWEMIRQNISPSSIKVTGIPVRPEFFDKISDTKLKKLHNIKKDEAVVLLLAGGQGMMNSSDITKLLYDFKDWKRPINIIAIAGSNKKLFNTLKEQEQLNTARLRIHAIGWTDKMHVYMAMADAVISKPGGITTSECLTLGKPLITIRPIPGQEESNASHILEVGGGYVARTDDDIIYYLEKIFSEKQRVHKKPLNPAASILNTVL